MVNKRDKTLKTKGYYRIYIQVIKYIIYSFNEDYKGGKFVVRE